MVNEGRLAPGVDVVQALREESAGVGNNAKSAGGKGPTGKDDASKSIVKKGFAKKDVSVDILAQHILPKNTRNM